MNKSLLSAALLVAATMVSNAFAADPLSAAAATAVDSSINAAMETVSKDAPTKSASSESSSVREERKKAKKDLEEAKKALETAQKELRENQKKLSMASENAKEALRSEGATAVANLAAAQIKFDEARTAYAAAFSISHRYHTETLLPEQVGKRLAKYEKTIVFRGDTTWLASTSVDGKPLLSHFDGADSVEAAVASAMRAATEGGFFFAGLEVMKEKDGDRSVVLVDKGRVALVNVVFEFENAKNKKNAKSGNVFSDTSITNMLSVGNGLEAGKAFNWYDLRNRFAALNAHPDIEEANVVLKILDADKAFDYPREDGTPGTKGRGVAADVIIQDRASWFSFLGPVGSEAHLSLGIDNFGSLGAMDSVAGDAEAWMARATLQWLNVWDCNHSITLSGLSSIEGSLWGGTGAYMVPRKGRGSLIGDGIFDPSLTIHGGFTEVDEEAVVPGIDVEGKGKFGGAQVSARLWENQAGDAYVDASVGATYREVESAIRVGGQRLEMGKDNGSPYDICPLSVALMGAWKDGVFGNWTARNYWTAEYVRNLGGSSAEELGYYRSSVDEDGDQYQLFRAQFARLQMLGDTVHLEGLPMLFFRVEGQYAPDPLVGAEQFGLGGHNSVRGYAEREFMGDSGFSATVELRTPLMVGLFSQLGLDRWQFLTFYDVGRYELIDGLGEGSDDTETLSSWGLGLRLGIGDTAQFRLDWGLPLKKDDAKFESSHSGRITTSFQLFF